MAKKLQMAFFAISSFVIIEKITSELTESPGENGKLYSGFHVREKINQLTSNLISRWGKL